MAYNLTRNHEKDLGVVIVFIGCSIWKEGNEVFLYNNFISWSLYEEKTSAYYNVIKIQHFRIFYFL